jgi:DNA-binding LacI/PurR family transcriptional regulator
MTTRKCSSERQESEAALAAVFLRRSARMRYPRLLSRGARSGFEDTSIAGFDDIALGCQPSLTTVRVPIASTGEGAARTLLSIVVSKLIIIHPK